MVPAFLRPKGMVTCLGATDFNVEVSDRALQEILGGGNRCIVKSKPGTSRGRALPGLPGLLAAARLRTLRWERNKERRESASTMEENPAPKISHHDVSRAVTVHLH